MREFERLLQQLEDASGTRERVSVADIRHQVGNDAYGPALLILGIVALSPVGDIPGAPTVLSVLIIVIAVQMVAGNDYFWLPNFLLRRSVKAKSLRKAIGLARPAARFLGRLVWPRLTVLAQGLFSRLVAAICILLALSMPPLEVVPFGTTVPSSAITAFGLALVARDGLLASVATALSGGTVYLVVTTAL